LFFQKRNHQQKISRVSGGNRYPWRFFHRRYYAGKILATHRDSAPAAVYNGPETIQENAVSARLLFWQRAWDIFKDRPLTGGGLASYPELHKQYLQPPFYYSADPHNLYLKILAELGIIAFLVFIGFIASFLRRFLTFANHLKKPRFEKNKPSVILWR
jgi:hypothetical protein